ncbi:nucleotide exchange factor GrpE [Anaerococcus sp. NML200537]|uniref:nucleotide exchange factor GrpE n=1 Tax=Anaerococcus sp. NML200537 TaxID=2954485 RepID=UPI002237CF49|nr:nucleotide exchange factor GrpE [Anaerococcus sp. NML200537]MCW6701735.1 nucleotide exchange factor GrpE [Anaerococcus sp. NML200537]
MADDKIKDEEKLEEENIKENPEDEEVIDAEIVEDTEETSSDDNEYLEKYQRLMADFANYKQREEKSKADFKKFASSSLIEKLLPVLDNFDRALKDKDMEDPFVKGVIMIRDEFLKTLKSEGLEEIESDGCVFDHNLHHAVMTEASDTVKEDYIIETFQKGYTLHGKVLRPAMVKVSK